MIPITEIKLCFSDYSRSCVVSTYLHGVFDCMFLSCHVRVSFTVAVTYIASVSSKEFLDIQATIECGFTLKRVRDIIKTYSQILFSLSLKGHNIKIDSTV